MSLTQSQRKRAERWCRRFAREQGIEGRPTMAQRTLLKAIHRHVNMIERAKSDEDASRFEQRYDRLLRTLNSYKVSGSHSLRD